MFSCMVRFRFRAMSMKLRQSFWRLGGGRRLDCWLPAGVLMMVGAASFAGVVLAAQAGGDGDRYRLGTGDQIKIQVFGEEDLSLTARVGEKGGIAYPLLGELSIAGLTVREVEDLVIRRLKGPYLVDPKVTVFIEEYRPFYVNGEVQTPGSYPFQPGLTIRKAVSLAGGFSERAAKGKIFLISDADPKRTPRKVGLEHRVRPGDIITVEQSFF